MNSLDKVTLNSVNLIDERLQLLQKELEDLEKEYGPLKTVEIPVVKSKISQRYQELPTIQPEPAKSLSIKPQIKEEYLKTLQYVPDIMSEYLSIVQEPQYLSEVNDLVIPPRPEFENPLLFTYLEQRNKDLL